MKLKMRKIMNKIQDKTSNTLRNIANKIDNIGVKSTIIKRDEQIVSDTTKLSFSEYVKQSKEDGFTVIAYNAKLVNPYDDTLNDNTNLDL